MDQLGCLLLKIRCKIAAEYVPTEDNEADELSKVFQSKPERKAKKEPTRRLNPRLFERLAEGRRIEVDLFASKKCHQLKKYVSMYRDYDAWKVNAFTFTWRLVYGYANPPANQLPRILKKIRTDEPTLYFIFPVWASAPL